MKELSEYSVKESSVKTFSPSKTSVKTRCKKGTQRYKPMGPDCYTGDEINKWKETQKVKKLLNKTKKNA